jgi:hypothetical protein
MALTAPGENSLSIRTACKVHKVGKTSFLKWKNNIVEIMSAPRKKSFHQRPLPSISVEAEEDLFD